MYLIVIYFLVFIFIKLIPWIVQLEQAILLHVLMTSELFWCKSYWPMKELMEIWNITKNCKSVWRNRPLSILWSVYLVVYLRYVMKFLVTCILVLDNVIYDHSSINLCYMKHTIEISLIGMIALPFWILLEHFKRKCWLKLHEMWVCT